MFGAKRNFSILESPGCTSSPLKRIRLSSIRLETSESNLNGSLEGLDKGSQSRLTTPIKDVDQCNGSNSISPAVKETPPPTPIDKPESKIEIMGRSKSHLLMEINSLDEQIQGRLLSIKTHREKIIEFQVKNLVLEDYIQVASKSLCEIRNLLNEVHNPGTELAKQVLLIISDSHRNHSKKFEKITFELNHLMETLEEAIRNKAKQQEHEIALHERTLLTLDLQRRHNLSQDVEREVATEKDNIFKEDNPEPIIMNKSDAPDDDCVIIDVEEKTNSIEPVKVPSEMDRVEVTDTSNVTETNQSENTVTCIDEEETDIEDSKDEDEERSFTPCQAQRPK